MTNRDTYLLAKIVFYCERVAATRQRFGDSLEAFAQDYAYQDACGMCIIQVGEFAGKLSDVVRDEIPEIPWPLIRAMRNVFAHDYGAMDVKRTWATITQDIPALAAACSRFLQTHPE